jgi:hypothetical protein
MSLTDLSVDEGPRRRARCPNFVPVREDVLNIIIGGTSGQ